MSDTPAWLIWDTVLGEPSILRGVYSDEGKARSMIQAFKDAPGVADVRRADSVFHAEKVIMDHPLGWRDMLVLARWRQGRAARS